MCDLDESAWREREAYREAASAPTPTAEAVRGRPAQFEPARTPTAISADA